MNLFATLVKAHAARYPLMQPCDAVKLLYQHEFGGGHLIANEKESLLFLEEEALTVCPKGPTPFLEDIGNGYVRMHLSAIEPQKLPLYCFHKIFVESSKGTNGTLTDFNAKLDVLRRLSREKTFSFTPEALDEYLKEYQNAGFPLVSHSDIYRSAYHPAYRVISEQYALLLPVIYSVNLLLRKKSHVVLAIDGNSAAGKTTTAKLLSVLYGANVIHMDDFFLPPQLRTQERYKEAGGNIHYERFEQEVVPGLCCAAPFTYRSFDCKTSSYSGVETITPAPLTIIEGAYSLHPRYAHVYDLKLFLSVSVAEQKRRILKRNGEDDCLTFFQRWIPLENHYFDSFSIRENCDLRL